MRRLRTICEFATIWFRTLSLSLTTINGQVSFAIAVDHRYIYIYALKT